MPLVIPAGYSNIKVTITNSAGGLSSRSTISYAFKMLAALDSTDVSRIANLMRDGHTPLYDNGWLLGPVHFTENVAGVLKVWEDTGTEAGIATSAVYASPAVAIVVSKRTGILGRAHRGRVYLPGVPEASVDEAGVVNGATVNSFQTVMDNLLTALNADAAIDHMALLHDDSTPGALAPDIVANLLVRNVVGNMRPRQRR